jgi:hypothetical protein
MKVDLTNNAAVKTVNATLTKLSSEREVWEAGDYARANETLYRLLANCLGLYVNTFKNCTETVQKEIRANIEAHLKKHHIKVQKNSQTLNLFVKFVFGSDRKRADKYASVLRVSITEKQTEATFAEWIKAQGGVEEVKRRSVKSAEAQAKQDAIDAAIESEKQKIDAAQNEALGTVSFNKEVDLGDRNLLIADLDASGKLQVVGVLTKVSDGLLKHMHREMGKLAADSADTQSALGAPAADTVPVNLNEHIRPASVASQPVPVSANNLNEPVKKQANSNAAHI